MIYNPTHSGKVLTTAEVTSLVHDADFQGFLSKADLERLLDQPDCVGIRVYYAAVSTTDMSMRIMAVGVRENGTEKDGRGGVGYILSPFFDPNNLANGTTVSSRNVARDLVDMGFRLGKFPQFASFFSRSMLTRLLENKNDVPVAGIGFFNSTFHGSTGDIQSHIGASFANVAGLQRVPNNPAFAHIQSDLPCPDACIALAPGVTEVTATAATVPAARTSDSIIYLVNWNG